MNFIAYLLTWRQPIPFFVQIVQEHLVAVWCSRSTAEKKGKICWLPSLWVAGGSREASSLGWFLGGFWWFLLVAGDIGWFQVVYCYTNFTTFRRVGSLLYSWTHMIDWGHLVFLFKVRQQEKDYCWLVA